MADCLAHERGVEPPIDSQRMQAGITAVSVTTFDPTSRASVAGVDDRLLGASGVFSSSCAVAVAVLGLAVLAGWAFDIEALKSFWPDTLSMKANTALGLVLAGLALWFLQQRRAGSANAWIGRCCALASTLVGALTLVEYLFGLDLGIDQLLFVEPAGAIGTVIPGRMSPFTAVDLLLLGTALLLIDAAPPGAQRMAEALAFSALVITLSPLLSYLYGAPDPGAVIHQTWMAPHTAIGVLLLSLGTLCVPWQRQTPRGLAAILIASGPGGVTARRLVPIAVIAPVLVGWTSLIAEREGLYGTELGESFTTTATVVALLLLVGWTAHKVERSEARKTRDRKMFGDLLEAAPDATILVDQQGLIQRVNGQVERLFGYRRGELVGQAVELLLPAALRERHVGRRQAYAAAPNTRVMGAGLNLMALRADGSSFPVDVSLGPVKVDDGFWVTAAVRDVSERRGAEEKIRQLNATLEQRIAARTAELQAANQDLESFSYSVSHDLRAPLRAIDNFSAFLLKDHAHQLDAEGQRLLGVIRRNTVTMSDLINDMLAFAHAGKQHLGLSSVDLEAMAREVFAELKPASAAPVALTVSPLPCAWADRAMLRQVVVNLLSNAIKFSSGMAAPAIEFCGRVENAETLYTVHDNGAGFDPRYAHKLFGIFQRLHAMTEFPGTGIGLAIVKRIVERHGGRVWAQGLPGQGATIGFALPRQTADTAPASAAAPALEQA